MKIINNKNLNKYLKETDKPIILFFTSKNCKYCKEVDAHLNELKDNSFVILKSIDDTELCTKFLIRSFPTILTFKKNKEPVDKIIGNKSKSSLNLKINQIK